MDLIYYKERIRRFEEDYQKKYFKDKKLLALFIFLHLILVLLCVILYEVVKSNLFFLISLFIIASIFLISQYIKIYKFYVKSNEEFIKLIFSIINEEKEVEITRKNKDEEYAQVKSTRLINSSDSVSIKYAYDYQLDNSNGTVFLLNASRSNGKAQQTILDGMLIHFKTDSNYDFVLRNDSFEMEKGKKAKNLSTRDCNVFFSKDKFKDDLGNSITLTISPLIIKKYELIKKYTKNILAIDFNNSDVFVYLDKKLEIRIPKQFTQKNIEALINDIVKFVETAKEINNIIE